MSNRNKPKPNSQQQLPQTDTPVGATSDNPNPPESAPEFIGATASRKASAIIKPHLAVKGETHPLQDIFDGPEEDMPEMTSVGIVAIGKSAKTWMAFTMKSKGTRILSIEVGEPDERGIAEETAKIDFVNKFMNTEA